MKNRNNFTELLSENDVIELTNLANEPIDQNTISLEEFIDTMEKWRVGANS